MLDVRLYRDRFGYPRADASPPHEVLGWFLEQDVQSDAAWGRELAGIVGDVRAGAREAYTATGNAHTLVLSREAARIETEFSDPPHQCTVSLQELERALLDWSAFVAGEEPGGPGEAADGRRGDRGTRHEPDHKGDR